MSIKGRKINILPLYNYMDKEKHKMTDEEQHDWLELCSYVKTKLLQYSNNMKFPKSLALRLKGLSEGKFMANGHIHSEAKYSFKTILITCKICQPKITKYLQFNSGKIKDENHKINIVMKFIEEEINDVYLRIQAKQRSEEKIQNVDLSNQNNESANYTTKSKTDIDTTLEKLW